MLRLVQSLLVLASVTHTTEHEVQKRWDWLTTPPTHPPSDDHSTTDAYYGTPNFLYDEQIHLSPPDRDGARTVIKLFDDGTTLPICDDGFTDLDATLFCNLLADGYNSSVRTSGRRTSRTTKKEFYATQLHCFKDFHVYWIDGFKTLVSYANCTIEKYTEESLPCAPSQAVAVYCWIEELVSDFVIDSIDTTKSKWSIIMKMYDIKQGRYFNALSGAIVGLPSETNFEGEHCGEVSPKFKVKFQETTSQIGFSGKFVDGCEECMKFYYNDQALFHGRVCPGEKYELEVEWHGQGVIDIVADGDYKKALDAWTLGP